MKTIKKKTTGYKEENLKEDILKNIPTGSSGGGTGGTGGSGDNSVYYVCFENYVGGKYQKTIRKATLEQVSPSRETECTWGDLPLVSSIEELYSDVYSKNVYFTQVYDSISAIPTLTNASGLGYNSTITPAYRKINGVTYAVTDSGNLIHFITHTESTSTSDSMSSMCEPTVFNMRDYLYL